MWTCENCGEASEDTFEICWNCGTSKAGVADPSFHSAEDPQFDDRNWAQHPYDSGKDESFGKPESKPKDDVPTHLVKAILITIFCCAPFGIVALVYASRVSPRLAGGDYQGAVQASKSAKKWAIWGFVLGLLVEFGTIVVEMSSAK